MSERKRIARIFRMRGLTVQSTALDALLNVIDRERTSHKDDNDTLLLAIIDEVKERMVQGISQTNNNNSIVTATLLGEVVANLSRSGRDAYDESVQLLDAFRTPRLCYDPMRKNFELVLDKASSLHGEAIDKVNMFAQRYELVRQRMLRHDSFQPKLLTAGASSSRGDAATHALTPVESLLGRGGVKYLLGMIVQVEESKYYLEDHTGQIPLDLSRATLLTDGFVTENSIVLVEGEAIDGVLYVHNLGSPIVENRFDAITTIGLQNTDIFDSIGSLSELEKLREQEIKHGQEGMFVVLSDVYLDSPAVMERIERMLAGYSTFAPLPIFVFMGNFTSRPLSGGMSTKSMMGCYEDLANVICKFPIVASEGRFILIPGPNDPGAGGVLPRGPIPNFFASELKKRVRHVTLASNPCRIRYLSKELVFFRDNLVGKMRRHCLLDPREDEDEDNEDIGVGGSPKSVASVGQRRLTRHAIKTVFDQGHLSPLPLSASPIFWQYDHVLRLYPFPDALIVGDAVDQYYENYKECDAINPGPFSNGFNFMVYHPIGEIKGLRAKSDVEFCEID